MESGGEESSGLWVLLPTFYKIVDKGSLSIVFPQTAVDARVAEQPSHPSGTAIFKLLGSVSRLFL